MLADGIAHTLITLSKPPLYTCSPFLLIAKQNTGPVWLLNVYNGSTSKDADL